MGGNLKKLIIAGGLIFTLFGCASIKEAIDLSYVKKKQYAVKDRWGSSEIFSSNYDLYLRDKYIVWEYVRQKDGSYKRQRRGGEAIRLTSTPNTEETSAVFIDCANKIIYSTEKQTLGIFPTRSRYLIDIKDKELKSKRISLDEYNSLMDIENKARERGRC